MRIHSTRMTTRREIIQLTIGFAAVATAAPTFSAVAGGTEILPLYKVVYDERLMVSRLFADEARYRGADVHSIRGEVDALWYKELYFRWKSSPVAIAGMTTYHSMFVLAMMARDVRMRVLYRAHHKVKNARDCCMHEVFGPFSALGSQPALLGPQQEWTRIAARIVTSWPTAAMSVKRAESNIAHAEQRAVEGNTLVTWMIAPAGAA